MQWKNVKFWVWIEVFMPINIYDNPATTEDETEGQGGGTGGGWSNYPDSGDQTPLPGSDDQTPVPVLLNPIYHYNDEQNMNDYSKNHSYPFETIEEADSGSVDSSYEDEYESEYDPNEGYDNDDPNHQDCGTDPVGYSACFDVLRFASEFELNAIPTALVSVALGRRADNTELVSNIHYYVNNMKLQLKAWVWCLALTNEGEAIDEDFQFWPQGKFRIFDGYVTGSGFKRNGNSVELSLGLTHWLTDMNFSSTLSRQTHPMAPGQLYYPANYGLRTEITGASFTGSASVGLTPEVLAKDYFEPNIILDDFWGGNPLSDSPRRNGGLKDWLTVMTYTDRLNSSEIRTRVDASVSPFRPTYNWEACRALSRFEPNASYNGTDEEGYVLGIPLGFSPTGDLNSYIASALGGDVGRETFDTTQGATMWNKLAGTMQASYMMAIIPLVEKALVVPSVSCLSDPDNLFVHRILRTRHYESIEISGVMPKALRAVGLFANRMAAVGDGPGTTPNAPMSIGGWFDRYDTTDDPRYNEGLIQFARLPSWVNCVQNNLYVNTSTGLSADIRTIASIGAGAVVMDALNPANIIELSKTVWDACAKTYYLHEVFKGRQGTVGGPVRFDIAPGSTIMVEVAEDKYVKDIINNVEFGDDATTEEVCLDAYYTFVYCTVFRVSTVIDGQNMRAGTSFYLGNIHSEAENRDSATSVTEHPIWSQAKWGGCTLIQDTAFTPMATTLVPE